MKKEINYTSEPMEMERINDFLPNPGNLVLNEDNVRVTLNLSKHSVKSFKNYAKKNKAHYQTMIRNLLDIYADKYLDAI